MQNFREEDFMKNIKTNNFEMRRSVIVVFLFYLTQTINTKQVQNYSSFGYSFPVNYAEKCPRTAEEWDNSSRRLNCSKTHVYHCAPDKNLSSLIEFCYPSKGYMFQKGNCLELADVGILNHVKCGHFSFGCPDKDFSGNEIYKFPSCLSITANCFTADVECLNKKCLKQGCNGVPKTEDRSTDCPSKDNIYLPWFVVSLVLFFLSAGLNLYLGWQRIKSTEEESHEHDRLLEENTSAKGSRTKEQRKDEYRAAYIEKEIFSDYAVEEAELFQLLKRQCLNDEYTGFQYLVKTRIKSKGEGCIKIFCQRDEYGCTLLHYAAQGGSIFILKEILKSAPAEVKSHNGQTILHYAIRYQHKDMSLYLINTYETLTKDYLVKECNPSPGIGSEMCSSEEYCEPLHWAAWNGDMKILDDLKQANIDIRRLTKNGLSILDIACLKSKPNFCLHILENEKGINLDKKDACGWNIAHYAARSNNVEVLEHLRTKKESLITDITHTKKTTFHIACEYAQLEAVKHLTETQESLLLCKDEREWNALHYAAKGGNLQILRFLVKDKKMKISSRTKESKNLLHVACTYKQGDICKYVAQKHKHLVNETTTMGWLPAHYVGVESKGDGREEKIVDILFDCGMNIEQIKQKTKDGYSVLGVAIYHRNGKLLKYLSSMKDKIGFRLDIKFLLETLEETKDSIMRSILEKEVNERQKKMQN
ncbi:uncharacterized protein LOC125653861 isoform X1 [Ostrea edulis]|uniref:uncharacterized protein LOC125653861 isoform X1 n=2 Tax=Ostrea edulis TaxID=37623 RepID=UPI0024AEF292|nr:uncharacterized protein LOC125653861 isoform X1 [Ostrea edulis]